MPVGKWNTSQKSASAQKEVHEVGVPELAVLYLNDAVSTKYKILCKVQIESPAGHT